MENYLQNSLDVHDTEMRESMHGGDDINPDFGQGPVMEGLESNNNNEINDNNIIMSANNNQNQEYQDDSLNHNQENDEINDNNVIMSANNNQNQEYQGDSLNHNQENEEKISLRHSDITSSFTSSKKTKNYLRQFLLPFLSKYAGKRSYQSFFTEQQQNLDTYQQFIQEYFRNLPQARKTVSKNALQKIWSLPATHKEALFFRSLVGKYTLDRFIEIQKNMDKSQKLSFINWFKTQFKELMIHLGEIQEELRDNLNLDAFS